MGKIFSYHFLNHFLTISRRRRLLFSKPCLNIPPTAAPYDALLFRFKQKSYKNGQTRTTLTTIIKKQLTIKHLHQRDNKVQTICYIFRIKKY